MELEIKQLSKKEKALYWIKDHKTQIGLAITGATIVSLGVYVGIKTGYISYLKTSRIQSSKIDIGKMHKVVKKTSLPKGNLTGIKKTATGLGKELLLSPQDVNKRFITRDMITKLPNGEYALTDLGKLFGKETTKTTRAGHTFSNIEWDTSVVSEIFSPEELMTIAEHKAKLDHILNSLATS